MKTDFDKQIKDLVNSHKFSQPCRIVILRNDGIVIYDTQAGQSTQPIGALSAGVWEAAHALIKIKTTKVFKEDFRLSFDTSSEGIHILDFKRDGQSFLLCGLFEGIENPGKLKMELAKLKANLSQAILSAAPEKERAGYLFTSISDDEMNQLFGL